MTAEWWSQRYPAEGGAAAEGISRQLGRPSLDPLTVLVREAAQNSWDARNAFPVEFVIEIGRLGERANAWRRHLLPGPADPSSIALDAALEPDRYVIRIGDRNTRGLGGPLRADERVPEGTVANFVQFIRNVGEPRDQVGGGGTYGFGKGSLYAVSSAKTILLDSHCIDGIGAPRRLMASSLGHSYYQGSVRHTGRHWWGDIVGGIPDPVLGDRAAGLARELGLPGFDDGRYGSDIVILGADLGRRELDGEELGERAPEDAAIYIVSALLWSLWPKFGSTERDREMDFRVIVEGHEVAIPVPEQDPYLAPFSVALDAIHRGEGYRYTRTVSPKHAGSLAFELTEADPQSQRSARRTVLAAMPFSPPFHHICRMRAAELVVDYLDAPVPADPMFGYAGVFLASDDPKAEQAFATSEPPTHDDWVERGLSGTDLGVVRGARKFIRDTLTDALAPRGRQAGDAVSGLGALAAELSGIIPTTSGNAPSAREARDRVGGVSRPRQPYVKGEPRVVLDGETPFVVAHVVVPPGAAQRRITAAANVVLEGGGAESQPPLGAVTPHVVGWRRASDQWATSQSALDVSAAEDSEWFVFATHVPDAVIRVTVRTEELS